MFLCAKQQFYFIPLPQMNENTVLYNVSNREFTTDNNFFKSWNTIIHLLLNYTQNIHKTAVTQLCSITEAGVFQSKESVEW